MTVTATFELPILSLADAASPEGEARAAAQFRAAALSTGFLQLVRAHSVLRTQDEKTYEAD